MQVHVARTLKEYACLMERKGGEEEKVWGMQQQLLGLGGYDR